MKPNVLLTITSLLSLLLMTVHLADDIRRGLVLGGVVSLAGAIILVVWLYGTLVLAERRSGYAILLVASLLASFVPVIHMGAGVGGEIAKSSGAFFFVWTLIALEVTSIFSLILSARGLWSLQRGQPRTLGAATQQARGTGRGADLAGAEVAGQSGAY